MLIVATLMGLVAALAAGLSLGASTVALVAGNYAAAADARAAADAGAEHGLAAILAALPRWREMALASPDAALPDLLQGGRLWQAGEAAGFPRGAQPFGAGSYSVEVVDDDAPVRALGPADVAAIGEDGNAAHDANGRLVIRSVAAGARGASATVEAVIGLVPLPAVLLRGPARIGAATLTGRAGDIHVSGDLDVAGALAASGTVEATGRLAAAVRPATSARVGGRARALPLPEIRPADFRAVADFVLRADGAIGDAAGVVICQPGGSACPSASVAWAFAAGQWTLVGVPAAAATVFVEGDALLAPLGAGPDPASVSLCVTGSVHARGPMAMRPAARGLLIVAGTDVRIEGPLTADAEEGLIAAGEQIAVVGPARLRGSLVASGRGHASALVRVNEVAAGATIAADGALLLAGLGTWKVLGWRRDQAW